MGSGSTSSPNTRPHHPQNIFGCETMPTIEINGTETNSESGVPAHPGAWSLKQIIKALSKPLPDQMLQTRRQGGRDIRYIPWYTVSRILDKYCPGWSWEIRSVTTTHDRLFLVGRLTIPTAEGLCYREATGTELLKEDKEIWIGEKPNRQPIQDEFGRPITEPKELAYGDPSSNAESMAFRRAAARFGLGLYLYERD